MKQWWWNKGGVYLNLEVVRVAAISTEDFMESDAEMEAEEQRVDVEYWTRQIAEVSRVN